MNKYIIILNDIQQVNIQADGESHDETSVVFYNYKNLGTDAYGIINMQQDVIAQFAITNIIGWFKAEENE